MFIHFLQKFQATPSIVVFFNLRPLSKPTVPNEERYTVTRPLKSGAYGVERHFFRVTLRHGYMDEVLSVDLGSQIYEQLRNFVIRESATGQGQPRKHIEWAVPDVKSTSDGMEVTAVSSMPSLTAEDYTNRVPSTTGEAQAKSDVESIAVQQQCTQHDLSFLEAAYQDQVVYIVGKEQMRIQEVAGYKPKGWCRRIALAAFLWLRSNTGSKIANFNIGVDKLVEVGFVKII